MNITQGYCVNFFFFLEELESEQLAQGTLSRSCKIAPGMAKSSLITKEEPWEGFGLFREK